MIVGLGSHSDRDSTITAGEASRVKLFYMATSAQERVGSILEVAGITVGGSQPFDIEVLNPAFYERVLKHGELAFGESYMDGWWRCDHIDQFTQKFLESRVRERLKFKPSVVLPRVLPFLLEYQSQRHTRRDVEHHYNIGNDLFERMLDRRMIYSCAYWKDAETLDQAQEDKLDLICRKLELQEGMTILDIGCGWGGFARFAAERYGAHVTGITIASEQAKLAEEVTRDLPVKIAVQDYRQVTGIFDRIVSIGMLEHVGPRNYRKFFGVCDRALAPHGIMLHHTIGANKPDRVGSPWLSKYIFPGGRLPTLSQVSRTVEGQLAIEDVQNFGPYYDKTLMAWYGNFVNSWDEIRGKYGERFYRMWELYLLLCAGAFRARHLQLYQVVIRRAEPGEPYIAPR
jgi:cyclopropane-fatty-acyl-phospholipid synthase